MPSRKTRSHSRKRSSKARTRRGGNSLAALGQAASNLILPAGLLWAAKRQQKGRSISKLLRSRRF